MKLFRSRAAGSCLSASQTDYVGRQPLRISKSGDHGIEAPYHDPLGLETAYPAEARTPD
jgi:hypothetical protein